MDKFSIYLSIARKLQETGQSAQFARYTAIVPTWVKKKFIKEFKLQDAENLAPFIQVPPFKWPQN